MAQRNRLERRDGEYQRVAARLHAVYDTDGATETAGV